MYNITQYTYDRARVLGVDVKPSKLKNKKIDIFLNDKKIYSVGQIGYMDYPTYLEEEGLEVANKRKQAFYNRHGRRYKSRKDFYTKYLLW